MNTNTLKLAVSSFVIAGCINTATIAQNEINFDFLDVNNIKATVNASGHLFGSLQNIPEKERNGFEIKNTDGKHAVRIAGIWMGGKEGSKYHINAPTFGVWGRDVYQGPVMKQEFYSSAEDAKWNRVWKVSKESIKNHIDNFASKDYIMPEEIANWPASGDIQKGQSPNLAPFVDVNSNGIYDPQQGDYPSIKGDQAVLFIYNDQRAMHTESIGTYPMGVEIIGMAYAFTNGFNKAYNNTIFVDYTIINRSGIDYTDTKLGVFTDIDLGSVTTDEYQGIDLKRNTYYGYNADKSKDSEFGKNKNPYMSVSLLNEPFSGFMSYNNDCDINGNPIMPTDYYFYLNNYWKDGMVMTKGGNGKGGNVHYNYMYDGNPSTNEGWTEKSVNNMPGDRRGLGMVGPFEFKNGHIRKISVAYCFSSNFEEMQKNADKYSNDFKNNSGPFAPETPALAASVGSSIKSMDMLLYPNPANTNATISFSNPANETYSVNVYDMTGKKVITENQLTGTNYQLNTGKLEKGLYVVELLFKDKRNSSRLVVQ
jgi:hypothetical protein